jgi:uncharacterized HhH-GPD family protein
VAVVRADRLYFTGNDEADELLAQDPLALLIGFVLDQQVPLQRAFSAPLELKRRFGTLEPEAIAGAETAELERIFSERPALHRFPATMARRTQELCAAIVSEYGGEAERIWTEAKDASDLKGRLLDLPGIGDMKVRSLLAILVKRLGVRPAGWEEVVPKHPTLGDVDSPEALERYQDAKRAYKASLKATRAAE